MIQNAGIFLDRDGTINQEVDFLTSPDHLRLINGSAGAIREANECGFKVFVVTNQSGIARGILTEEDLAEIHSALVSKLEPHHARLDAIYYCPHHPDAVVEKYRLACDCRKPGTGMLMNAVREFGIDLTRSYIIGDRMIDIQTGNNCGATPILVLTGYGKHELELCRENNVEISFVAADLRAAIEHIKQTEHHSQPSDR